MSAVVCKCGVRLRLPDKPGRFKCPKCQGDIPPVAQPVLLAVPVKRKKKPMPIGAKVCLGLMLLAVLVLLWAAAGRGSEEVGFVLTFLAGLSLTLLFVACAVKYLQN